MLLTQKATPKQFSPISAIYSPPQWTFAHQMQTKKCGVNRPGVASAVISSSIKNRILVQSAPFYGSSQQSTEFVIHPSQLKANKIICDKHIEVIFYPILTLSMISMAVTWDESVSHGLSVHRPFWMPLNKSCTQKVAPRCGWSCG